MSLVVPSVSSLTAAPDVRGVALAWIEDDPHANGNGVSYECIDKVEVWASQTNNRASATKVAEGRKTALHATGLERSTWYYWIRPRLFDSTGLSGSPRYGDWYPLSATTGVTTRTGATSDATYAMQNGVLVVTRPGGNSLKVAIKTVAGNDPSPDDPVYTHFPNASGGYDLEKIDYAISFTFSNGSTAGFVASDPSRLWFAVLRTAPGSVVLAAVNCSQIDRVFFTFVEAGDSISATAEGGAGAADSVGVLYATSSASAKPYRIAGHADWNSGLATPGTWNADPDKVVDYRAGMPTPGMELSALDLTFYSAGSLGTTTFPNDNTIPQDSEGNLLGALSINFSPIDLIKTELDVGYFYSVASGIVAAVFWGGSTDAKGVGITQVPLSTLDRLTFRHAKRYGAVGSTTYSVRVGGLSAGTFTLNGNVGGTLGGLIASFLRFAAVVG
jgi:hypothetical protein